MNALRQIAEALATEVKEAEPCPLDDTCYDLSRTHRVTANEVFTIAKHLFARGILVFDLTAYRISPIYR